MTRGRPALVSLVLLVAVGMTAVIVELRNYEPLGPGSSSQPQLRGLASEVRAPTGSGGKAVLFPEMRTGRTYYVGFSVRNGGRFDVTIEGTPAHDPSFITLLDVVDLRMAAARPAAVRGSRWAVEPLWHSVPLDRLRVPSGEERSLWVGFRLNACEPSFSEGASMSTDVVRLRYTYLGVFHRTAYVEMPYAVTAKCGGEIPASTY